MLCMSARLRALGVLLAALALCASGCATPSAPEADPATPGVTESAAPPVPEGSGIEEDGAGESGAQEAGSPFAYQLCDFTDPTVPKPNEVYPFDFMLSTDTTGEDPNVVAAVKSLQEILRAEGYTGPEGQELPVDGTYGGWTANAVREFQKQQGLVVDGKVGPETWAVLAKETCWKYH